MSNQRSVPVVERPGATCRHTDLDPELKEMVLNVVALEAWEREVNLLLDRWLVSEQIVIRQMQARDVDVVLVRRRVDGVRKYLPMERGREQLDRDGIDSGCQGIY